MVTMQQDLVIVKLDGARRLLAEAVTIQQTKRVVDLALSAEVFARRQKLGQEAVGYATEIKMDALRQLGAMLKATERNNGTLLRGAKKEPREDAPPTLAELGLDKKTSKLAQDVAALPDELFDKVKDGAAHLAQAQKEFKRQERDAARAEMAESAKTVPVSDRWHVYTGDIQTWDAPRQYDCIITDPPYPREYVDLYGVLAERAKTWLKPGGLLIAMAGQSYLPEIYRLMGEHLTYLWTAAYLTPGGQSVQLFQRKVNTFWKPLLIFANGEYSGKWFGDVAKSAPNDNDKDNHEWGQSVSGMRDVVGRFADPGAYVLDPFCGAGTTGIAALAAGCQFDGLEVDAETANIAIGRLGL